MPDSNELVLTAGDAEAGANYDATDGRVLVQFVDLLQLVGLVVDLEEQPTLAAEVDPADFLVLLEGVGVVVEVLEVENREDCVAGVVVEDDGGAGQVLVLDSPEPDVLLATGN